MFFIFFFSSTSKLCVYTIELNCIALNWMLPYPSPRWRAPFNQDWDATPADALVKSDITRLTRSACRSLPSFLFIFSHPIVEFQFNAQTRTNITAQKKQIRAVAAYYSHCLGEDSRQNDDLCLKKNTHTHTHFSTKKNEERDEKFSRLSLFFCILPLIPPPAVSALFYFLSECRGLNRKKKMWNKSMTAASVE